MKLIKWEKIKSKTVLKAAFETEATLKRGFYAKEKRN